MPTDYRHRGCRTPMLRWMPPIQIQPSDKIRSVDWQLLPAEEQPVQGAPLPVCPDCNERVRLTMDELEAL